MQKRKNGVIVLQAVKDLNNENLTTIGDRLPKSKASLVSRYMRDVVEARNSQARVDYLEAQFEIEAEKELALSKTLIKMGPMLGLMGTLIPMGPALVGLTAGDMETIGLRACALARGGVVTEECFYQGAVDHTWFVPSDVGNSLDHILSDIRERFVGMEGVEQYFVDKAEEVREQLAHGGSEDGVYLRPIVLRGEPGTGKTEVATMLGRLYHHLHLLGTPEPIIISGSTLASSLQGGSQQKVLEYVREAQERKALLFVDEAHQLVSNSFDGQGALKAFLNPLTDKAHPFMCVFAVYPSMYQAFCRLDPGSASRFQVLDLPSYTGPELHAILHKMMERHAPKLTRTPETDQALRLVCAHIYDTRTEETGNGRRMERLLEDMNVLRRRRCRAAGLPDDAAERLVFQLADIPRDLLATISE